MADEKIKKTHARKKIGRKIQPRQFESVDISIECEDEIEWTTIEERQKKLEKLTKLALIDFQDTFQKVCEELGVEDKRAFGKRYVGEYSGSTPKTGEKPESSKQDNKDDDDMESFFDGLE